MKRINLDFFDILDVLLVKNNGQNITFPRLVFSYAFVLIVFQLRMFNLVNYTIIIEVFNSQYDLLIQIKSRKSFENIHNPLSFYSATEMVVLAFPPGQLRENSSLTIDDQIKLASAKPNATYYLASARLSISATVVALHSRMF